MSMDENDDIQFPEFPPDGPEAKKGQGDFLDADASDRLHAAITAASGVPGPGGGAGTQPGKGQMRELDFAEAFPGEQAARDEVRVLWEIRDIAREIKGVADQMLTALQAMRE